MEPTSQTVNQPTPAGKNSLDLKLKNGNFLPLDLHEAAVGTNVLTKLEVLNNCWVSVSLIDYDNTNNASISKHQSKDHESDFLMQLNNAKSVNTSNQQSCSKNDECNILVKLVSFDDLTLRCKENFYCLDGLDSDVVYIHGETAFNACKDYVDIFQLFYKGAGFYVNIHPVNALSFVPLVASSVTISVVRSPQASSDNNYDQCLKRYFKRQRHLNVNQVFRVGDDQEIYLDSSQNCLWFKVISMEHKTGPVGSAWVQYGVTALFAMDSVNSFVPCVKCSVGKSREGSLGGNPSYTSGLSRYFSEVTKLLEPVLHRTVSPSETALLLHGVPAVGKCSLIKEICDYYCLHLYEVNCFTLIGESIAAMEQRIEGLFKKAVYCSPCVLLLRNIHALCKDKEGEEDEPRLIQCVTKCFKNLTTSSSIVFAVATTNCYSQLTTDLCRCFVYEIELEVPNEEERCQTLTGLCQGLGVSQSCVDAMAKKTAGMVLGDLCTLVSEAFDIAKSRTQVSDSALEKKGVESATNFGLELEKQRREDATDFGLELEKQGGEGTTGFDIELENGVHAGDLERGELGTADFDVALDKIHTEYKDMLGMPKIPQVSWSDVGGLVEVKAEIIDTIKIPLQYPELTKKGLRRSGILLYGPPGCGKTLLAKAVATEFSLNFFSVKGPELINMYVGQSEQNVRDMFKKARECVPCVVFFDELDSIAPNRGKSGDSGGVMDRVVSQLLAELDGMQSSNELFVIGATNRPDLLDNALLRPGRFDKLVYVGFPETKTDRINIMKSYTNKMNLDESFDLERIENCLPLYLTGADFYALCSDAVLNAIRQRIESIEEQVGENDGSGELVVAMSNFVAAAKELAPSISTQDVIKYKEMKQKIDNEKSKA